MHKVFVDLNRDRPVMKTVVPVAVCGDSYYRDHDGSLRRFASEVSFRGSDILTTGWHERSEDAWAEADRLLAEVAGRVESLRHRCREAVCDATRVA
jgi:hypothetical protein